MAEHKKIDGRTRRAADIALAKRTVSRASYDAILRGELSLAEAKRLGRDRGPDIPEGRSGPGTGTEAPRNAREQPAEDPLQEHQRLCLCGCEEPVRGKKSRFRPGHDARLHGELKRNLEKDPLLRNERFTDEQRAYVKERGLI